MEYKAGGFGLLKEPENIMRFVQKPLVKLNQNSKSQKHHKVIKLNKHVTSQTQCLLKLSLSFIDENYVIVFGLDKLDI